MISKQRLDGPIPKEHWAFSDGASGLLFNRQSMRLFPIESELA
jgi:hypothetical protein